MNTQEQIKEKLDSLEMELVKTRSDLRIKRREVNDLYGKIDGINRAKKELESLIQGDSQSV